MESSLPAWRTSSTAGRIRLLTRCFVRMLSLGRILRSNASFTFVLFYFVLFTFRASDLCQVQNLHDCRRALPRINNSLGRWAQSGFLPNWLPFFLHACSRGIYYPFALVPIYNFNAFGPFAFLPARVNMHGFAWFFLKEQFIFLNGGDPDYFACVAWCIHRAAL